MPTALLRKAASFTIGDEKFVNGVERNVSDDMANYLEENEPEQFRVRFNRHLEEQSKPVASPEDQNSPDAMPNFARMKKMDAIHAAAGYLNPDIETNFEEDGRPTIAALQAVIQKPVTVEDRDMAFRGAPRAVTDDTRDLMAERAEHKPQRPPIIIKKNNADPTTDGAVSV